MSLEIEETEQPTASHSQENTNLSDPGSSTLICIICNNSFEFWEGHICECRCGNDVVLNTSD